MRTSSPSSGAHLLGDVEGSFAQVAADPRESDDPSTFVVAAPGAGDEPGRLQAAQQRGQGPAVEAEACRRCR